MVSPVCALLTARCTPELERVQAELGALVNARMNKRWQMRWSPRGAHRVLQVRAVVLDERPGHQAIQLAA